MKKRRLKTGRANVKCTLVSVVTLWTCVDVAHVDAMQILDNLLRAKDRQIHTLKRKVDAGAESGDGSQQSQAIITKTTVRLVRFTSSPL